MEYEPDLKKTVRTQVDDRDRREELDDQVQEMGKDYQDMLRSREEAKKQLDAKFLDVNRKIQSTKEYSNAEAKRVNDMLKAFKSKFEYQMEDFKAQMLGRLAEESKLRKSMEQQNHKRLEEITKTLESQKEERRNYLNDLIGPVKEHLDRLILEFQREKTGRIEREKAMLEKLDDSVFELQERLDEEFTDRVRATGDLRDQVHKTMRTQDKNLENNQQKAFDALKDLKSGAHEEMNSRLGQQDDIADNMSNFMKTFQDTLAVLTSSD